MKEKHLILYHGSQEAVVNPVFGKGNPKNDYGLGFYCTENEDLAKEWACPGSHDGFANSYSLDLNDLKLLDLNAGGMSVLNWLAILLENRDFLPAAGLPAVAKQYLLDNYLPDYKDCDIIKGWRADDSYFAFAKAFLNGTISLRQLEMAMRLGGLGEQIVLKSPKAFDALVFQLAIPCTAEVWNLRRSKRDFEARGSFRQMLSERSNPGSEIFIIDIIRGRHESI